MIRWIMQWFGVCYFPECDCNLDAGEMKCWRFKKDDGDSPR